MDRSTSGCELVADVVGSFGEARLRVTGASMLPSIWPGDMITVRRRPISALKTGQVILLRRDGNLVAHRIINIHGDFLTTQGDTLPNADPPVREPDIIGQVVALMRNGRCIDPVQSPWQRVSSAVLRRSDFCMRMTLRLGLRLQGVSCPN